MFAAGPDDAPVGYSHRSNFWGYEGYRTPLFGLRDAVPQFSGRKGEEFAVTCCQQRRSVKIKVVFGRGFTPDPAGRDQDALPDPRVGLGGGYFLPILLLWPMESGLKGASFSF